MIRPSGPAPAQRTPPAQARTPAAPQRAPGEQPAPPPPEPSAGPLDRNEIYFVESDQDPTALLARRAGIDDGWVHWDDTVRDRLHRVTEVREEGELILVQTEAGFLYRFRPLTLELYDERVRANVELSPGFGSTEELREFYRTAVM